MADGTIGQNVFQKGKLNTGLPPSGYDFEHMLDNVVEIGQVTSGMVNRLPRETSPSGSGRIVRNARIRDYWTGRRPGTQEFGGTKPDSAAVLAVLTFITEALGVWVLRVTRTSFYGQEATGTWSQFSILDKDGAGTTFPDTDLHLTFASFFDKLYMADGIGSIWEIDFASRTVKEVEGAPRVKYITTYAERIIGANALEAVGGARPSLIVWPVNSDPTDWTGISSGREDLAANAVGDVITGIFGLEREMIIVRRRSTVHATRLPFGQSPFRFSTVFDGVGSDLPHSITRVPGGLVWADQRTREVYLYSPGAQPKPIGANVNRDLYEDLAVLRLCQGAYDPFEKEYHLGIVRNDGNGWMNRVWVFNFATGAWSFDDGPEVSAIGEVLLPGTSVAIDDLIGDIDSQSGTIDEYGSDGQFLPTMFKGTVSGEVIQQTYDADDDWDSTLFEFEFQSPNLGSVSKRRTLKDLELTVEAPNTGSYTLEHSNDEEIWRNTKTDTVIGVTTRTRLRLPKTMITGNDLYWRLKSTAAGIKLSEWWVRIMEKSLQHGTF